jgi:hypothetical protein
MKKFLFAVLFLSTASLGWAQSAGSDVKKWELQLQGGLSLPVSPYFAGGDPGDSDYKYNAGFNFGGAVGYKITPQLSVLANIQMSEFKSKAFDNVTYTTTYIWDTTEIAVLLKYRILEGAFTPFVFAGPGIALNSGGYAYHYKAPTPSYEDYSETLDTVAPMLEAGLGFEYAATDDLTVFAQVSETIDFADGYYQDWIYAFDAPVRYAPIQAGVILNL